MTAPPFKTIKWRKGKNSLKTIPFKTIMVISRPCRPDPCHSTIEWVTSVKKQIIWTPGPWCFDSPKTHQTPPASPAMSPPRHHSPRSPSFSPPASLPSRESSVEPSSEDSSPEGRKRHQSEPAFIRPRDINQGLTPGLSALLAETSPLAPYRLQRQAKAKAQKKIITHKWVISRPFASFQDHHVLHRPSMDSFHYIDLHGQLSRQSTPPIVLVDFAEIKNILLVLNLVTTPKLGTEIIEISIMDKNIINFSTPKMTDDKEDN